MELRLGVSQLTEVAWSGFLATALPDHPKIMVGEAKSPVEGEPTKVGLAALHGMAMGGLIPQTAGDLYESSDV